MRRRSRSSTKGPFFEDRLMSGSSASCQLPAASALPLALLPAPPPAHDEPARWLLLLAGPVAQRRNAPGRSRVATGGVVGLAAAVRVVDGVHRDAARLRPLAAVARAARLAELDELVLGVADGSDRGARLHRHHPHLTRGEAQRGVLALLRHELDRGARGAAELAAAARG